MINFEITHFNGKGEEQVESRFAMNMDSIFSAIKYVKPYSKITIAGKRTSEIDKYKNGVSTSDLFYHLCCLHAEGYTINVTINNID